MEKGIKGTDPFVCFVCGLIHELGHAYLLAVQGISGDHSQYENQIINGIEKKWSMAVGEPLRLNHGGIEQNGYKLFQHSKD